MVCPWAKNIPSLHESVPPFGQTIRPEGPSSIGIAACVSKAKVIALDARTSPPRPALDRSLSRNATITHGWMISRTIR
jgi:hypothetical protein